MPIARTAPLRMPAKIPARAGPGAAYCRSGVSTWIFT
jgi:hypothetical protein